MPYLMQGSLEVSVLETSFVIRYGTSIAIKRELVGSPVNLRAHAPCMHKYSHRLLKFMIDCVVPLLLAAAGLNDPCGSFPRTRRVLL